MGKIGREITRKEAILTDYFSKVFIKSLLLYKLLRFASFEYIRDLLNIKFIETFYLNAVALMY